MQISELTKETRKVTLNLEVGELNVWYRPGSYTAKLETQIVEGLERMPVTTVAQILSSILVSWDLQSGDTPYPCSDESLAELPAWFLIQLLRVIMEDMRPNLVRQPT